MHAVRRHRLVPAALSAADPPVLRLRLAARRVALALDVIAPLAVLLALAGAALASWRRYPLATLLPGVVLHHHRAGLVDHSAARRGLRAPHVPAPGRPELAVDRRRLRRARLAGRAARSRPHGRAARRHGRSPAVWIAALGVAHGDAQRRARGSAARWRPTRRPRRRGTGALSTRSATTLARAAAHRRGEAGARGGGAPQSRAGSPRIRLGGLYRSSSGSTTPSACSCPPTEADRGERARRRLRAARLGLPGAQRARPRRGGVARARRSSSPSGRTCAASSAPSTTARASGISPPATTTPPSASIPSWRRGRRPSASRANLLRRGAARARARAAPRCRRPAAQGARLSTAPPRRAPLPGLRARRRRRLADGARRDGAGGAARPTDPLVQANLERARNEEPLVAPLLDGAS